MARITSPNSDFSDVLLSGVVFDSSLHSDDPMMPDGKQGHLYLHRNPRGRLLQGKVCDGRAWIDFHLYAQIPDKLLHTANVVSPEQANLNYLAVRLYLASIKGLRVESTRGEYNQFICPTPSADALQVMLALTELKARPKVRAA